MSEPCRMTCKLQTKGHTFRIIPHFKLKCVQSLVPCGHKPTCHAQFIALIVLCRQHIAITGHVTSSTDSDFCSEGNTFESRTVHSLSRLKLSNFSSFSAGKFWYKRLSFSLCAINTYSRIRGTSPLMPNLGSRWS